jgi:4'-phosphopantetheinyl transferase
VVDLLQVHWLEQTEADAPADNTWLSVNELARLNGMRLAKRHADWRLGRWTAKRGLAAYLDLPAYPEALAKIELSPKATGAPEVFLANEPAAVTISLSHRDGRAVCAMAPSGVKLGCDLERIEPRSEEFIADYFATEEQTRIAQASGIEQSMLSALLWSAKESALKALQEGLRLDTRSVIVSSIGESFDCNGWSPLQVRCPGDRLFHGWWQHTDNFVRTLVADPPPAAPVILKVPGYSPSSAY